MTKFVGRRFCVFDQVGQTIAFCRLSRKSACATQLSSFDPPGLASRTQNYVLSLCRHLGVKSASRMVGEHMEVTARYSGGVAFEVEARGHRIICDQPKENSGADGG